MGNPMPLKYLFIAEYKDGVFKQTPEDVSVKDPKRSCFFDVDHDKLVRFHLVGDHKFTVDLRDGHFEVNGVSFFMHEEPLKDFRLIYFRKHTHHFNIQYEEKAHEIVYRMGWQTTNEKGENVQRVLEI